MDQADAATKIIEVQTTKGWKLFHRVPHIVYRNDPNFIAPLESDVESVFDPEKNKAHENGEIQAFVLLDPQGQPVGRIAAFIDYNRSIDSPYLLGGIGFFECIQNEAYAIALFQRAQEHLQDKGVKIIEGPVNFGERDKFWGLLTEGFYPPLYQENYNPEHYRHYFEDFGFRPFEQILTFRGQLQDVPGERFKAIAERASRRYGFHAVSLNESNNKTFAKHFTDVYNVAFRDRPFFKPISPENMHKIFQQLRPISDPRMAIVVYVGDKPVGFAAFIPDINPYLRKANGKLNFLSIPGFFYRLKTAREMLLKGIAFGILPEYQGTGVFAVLVAKAHASPTVTRYQNYYLATIRGHNSLMIKSITKLAVQVNRVHLSFRKNLDPAIPFEPYPFLERD